MPSLRNPFRKSTAVAPPAHINESTDSFASSTASTATDSTSVSSQRTSDNISKSGATGGLGRPYLSITPFPDVHTRTFSGDISDAALNTTAIPIASREKVIDNAGEYKLSVVNDSGVYLPPSPTEKKSFWRKSTSKVSSPIDRTSMDEPFTISRESCESYRRSFDISARSPVSETFRTSFDSRTRPSLEYSRGRPSFESSKLSRPVRIEEHNVEQFEDIKLDDAKTKKRGLFARFGADNTTTGTPTATFPFKTGLGLRRDVAVPAHESEMRSITEAK